MSGFGSQPFGSSSYGIGAPATAPAPGGMVLRDPNTNAPSGSRRIDPKTRDYVIDENGRVLGMNNTQQLVLMAVLTTRGSSAMPTLGTRLRDVEVITDNFERVVQSILEEALSALIAKRFISIVAVTVRRLHAGAAYINLRWRDLSTQQEHSLEI